MNVTSSVPFSFWFVCRQCLRGTCAMRSSCVIPPSSAPANSAREPIPAILGGTPVSGAPRRYACLVRMASRSDVFPASACPSSTTTGIFLGTTSPSVRWFVAFSAGR
eukprot:scaffold735_cov255-Pinguiococcus_pyrenoidosus.AAC.19